MKGFVRKSSSRASRKSADDNDDVQQPVLPHRDGPRTNKNAPEEVPWKLENEQKAASRTAVSSKTKASYAASSGKQGDIYKPSQQKLKFKSNRPGRSGKIDATGPSFIPNDPELSSQGPSFIPNDPEQSEENCSRQRGNDRQQPRPGAVAMPGIGVDRSGVSSRQQVNRPEDATVTLEAEVAPDLTEVIAEAEERARRQEREERERRDRQEQEQQQKEVVTATIIETKRIMGLPRFVFWIISVILIIGVIVGIVIGVSLGGGGGDDSSITGNTNGGIATPTTPTPTITPFPTVVPTLSSAPSMSPTFSPIVWTEVARFQNNASKAFGRTIDMSGDADLVVIGDELGNVVSYVPGISGNVTFTWEQQDEISIFSSNTDYGIAFDVSDNGDVIAIANPQSSGESLTNLFFWTGQNWLPVNGFGVVSGLGPTTVDEYLRGEFVALARDSSDVVAIGDLNANIVKVLARDEGGWGIRETLLLETFEFSEFGYAVDLSGDGNVLAVGARTGGAFQEGLVLVYDWDGSNYKLREDTPLTGENADDRLGFAVKLSRDGSVVAAGANFNDDGGRSAGSVRVFVWDGQEWNQRGTDLDGTEANSEFGRVLALNRDGTILAASSIFQEPAGTVYVYRWTGMEWILWGEPLEGKEQYGDFGSDIALSHDGDFLLVSEPSGFNRIGFVTLYQAKNI